jgi:hypothetical protein
MNEATLLVVNIVTSSWSITNIRSFLDLSLCGLYAMYMDAVKYIGVFSVFLRQQFVGCNRASPLFVKPYRRWSLSSFSQLSLRILRNG